MSGGVGGRQAAETGDVCVTQRSSSERRTHAPSSEAAGIFLPHCAPQALTSNAQIIHCTQSGTTHWQKEKYLPFLNVTGKDLTFGFTLDCFLCESVIL